MLLLGLDAILLLYITAGAGICMLHILQKMFKHWVHTNTMGMLLAGLVFCTVYFNLVSFWLPVNYISLLPLFAVSTAVFWQDGQLSAAFVSSIKKQVQFIFLPRNLPVTLPVLLMLLYYWLLPPTNADSPGYHYAAILWFEKYKVVPGLANVDGRLAYNAAAFILQAPYSFTSLAGQSLYPMNGVLVILFFLWMVIRILRSKSSFTGLVYFALLYLLNRVLLINMSSPTADVLVIVCVAYSIIKLFDAVMQKQVTTGFIILPVVILLYAVTAKLSACPALLLLPFILWLIKGKQKMLPLLFKLSALCLFIYVPWLCRNVMLSGYLLYPVPYIDIFGVDWKAPKDILMLDFLYIKRLPINFADELVAVKPPPFPQWVGQWISHQFNNGMRSDLGLFVLAVCSPVLWLISMIRKVKISSPVFCFWLIVYACVWLWFVNVPEYRFGIIFISFAILLPLLYVTGTGSIKRHTVLAAMIAVLFIAESGWYIYSAPGRKNIYNFSLSRFMLYPLKDVQYYSRNNKADFNYTILNTGVKLYHQDSAHICINTDLPCMTYRYGTIEMRGEGLGDGFRNVQNDVRKNYPFVK